MRKHVLRVSGCALLAVLSAAAPAQPRFEAGWHEDPVLGYKFRVPDKWEMVPTNIDEKWIVAKYNCNRDYAGKRNWAYFRPYMLVVHFDAEKAKTENLTGTGLKATSYRNFDEWFEDYMKGIGLGFHMSADEQVKVGDAMVKARMYDGVQTGETVLKFFVYEFPREEDKATFAVVFSQLPDWVKNVEKDFERSLHSFRFIEKTQEADDSARLLENPLWTRSREAWLKLDKAERAKMRQEIEAKRTERMLANVPQDWFTMPSRSKRFLALSHSDQKYTKLVLDSADATWKWMDDHFGDISDEYVMTGIIRICKDPEEMRTYRQSAGDVQSWSVDDREIVVYRYKDAGTGGGSQRLLPTGLLQSYLYDKDIHLATLPGWLEVGISAYLADADLKGGRFRFDQGVWERVALNEAEREDALRTFHDVINTTQYEWPRDRSAGLRFIAHLPAAVRFLESRDAKRIKALDGFLAKSVKAVIPATEAFLRERAKENKDVAMTEEQEEKQAQSGETYWRKRRRFVLDHVNNEVARFSEKEWAQIEAAWKRFITK